MEKALEFYYACIEDVDIRTVPTNTIEELMQLSIESESYEYCAVLRDELKRRSEPYINTFTLTFGSIEEYLSECNSPSR